MDFYDRICAYFKHISRQYRTYSKMYADTIGVWLKYSYFEKISKQEKLDISISTDEEIYDNACRIFDKLWNHEDGIRSVCVFISGLSNTRKKQLSIFDTASDIEDNNEKVQQLVDDLQNKFGKNIIRLGKMEDKK